MTGLETFLLVGLVFTLLVVFFLFAYIVSLGNTVEDYSKDLDRIRKQKYEMEDKFYNASRLVYEAELKLVRFLVEYEYVKDEQEGWNVVDLQANKQPLPSLTWRQAMLKFGLMKIATKQAKKGSKR